MRKLKNLNCDKTQKQKLRQNSNKQIVTKFENSNFYKTLIVKKNSKNQFVIVVIVTVVTVVVIGTYFSKNDMTPPQPMRCSQSSFLRFLQCFLLSLIDSKGNSVYKLQCQSVCVVVPSTWTRNCVKWRFLFKERISKISKVRTPLLLGLDLKKKCSSEIRLVPKDKIVVSSVAVGVLKKRRKKRNIRNNCKFGSKIPGLQQLIQYQIHFQKSPFVPF